MTWPFWHEQGDLATWVTAMVALLAVIFGLVPFVRDSRDRVRAQARGLIVYSQTFNSIGQIIGAENREVIDPVEVSLINKTERLVVRPVVVWTARRWAILRLLRHLRRRPVVVANMRRTITDDYGPLFVMNNPRSNDIVRPDDHMVSMLPRDQLEARRLAGREPWVLFRDASGRRWLLGVDGGALKRVWPWQGPLGRKANRVRPHQVLLPPEAMRQIAADNESGSDDSTPAS